MIKQKAIKIIYFSIFLILTINVSRIGVAHSTEFEIEEIITAIKNEIKTANISELGSPNFKIETVDVSINVVSTETEKGALAVKIVGYGDEVRNETLVSKSLQVFKCKDLRSNWNLQLKKVWTGGFALR